MRNGSSVLEIVYHSFTDHPFVINFMCLHNTFIHFRDIINAFTKKVHPFCGQFIQYPFVIKFTCLQNKFIQNRVCFRNGSSVLEVVHHSFIDIGPITEMLNPFVIKVNLLAKKIFYYRNSSSVLEIIHPFSKWFIRLQLSSFVCNTNSSIWEMVKPLATKVHLLAKQKLF